MVERARYYLTGLYRELWDKPVFLWAQAIAFKVLIALVPFVLLATGIIGRVLKQDRPMAYVESALRDVVPGAWGVELVAFLSTLQGTSDRFTTIGAVGLVLTTVTLFTTLRVVLSTIFSEDWHEQRSLFRGYLFDFQMAVQTGVLFLASIGVTVFMQTVGNVGLERLGMQGPGLQNFFTNLAQASLFVLPVLISLVMFFQLYWFIPQPRPPKRAALAGALTAALLWEVAKLAVTEYAGRFGFQDGWQSALGDTFLLMIVLVLWGYYSALVLNVGALTALLYERRRRLPETGGSPEVVVTSASTEVHTDAAEL